MYVHRNIVTRSRNHSCDGNETMLSVCTVELHVTVSNTKIFGVAQNCGIAIHVAGNNKMYLGLHVKCPILLSNFNQIWSFSTQYFKSSKYQISQKSILETALIHADMTKLLGAFRDNVNALQTVRIPSHRTMNLIQAPSSKMYDL
jgi:hypothetical protein